MNVYQIYIADREKPLTVDGDRVEITKDLLKVFQGTHEVAFFDNSKVEGCTVVHGTPHTETIPSSGGVAHGTTMSPPSNL